jgi:NADPH-dependent 2,4-dienoyl-CoA reductase/sulfur reductase-like enzyme
VAKLENVVVVGASLAGLRALQALRRAGFDGCLVGVGEEPHPPYDRPPLSKEVLSGKWDAGRTALLRPEDDEGLEVDWRLGERAVALDLPARRVRLASGADLPFDGLVIATGAAPRRIPGTPALAGIHVLRSLDDCLALRAELDHSPKVAVIGAGFIGAEVAATCRGRGLDVTVIEALPVPLEHALGVRMGRLLAELHRDHGVDLRCGVGVKGFAGSRRVERVDLADGSRVDADVVVMGIGVVPATGWLEGSGLALQDGVLCDARCAARAPGVVAAGDVARWHHPGFGETVRLEHWTNATEQAEAAAATLLAGEGDSAPYAPLPFFWSDQYYRKIQFGGRASPDDETAVVDGSLEERRFVMLYGREGRLRGVLGFNRPRLVMKYRALLREGASWEEALRAG